MKIQIRDREPFELLGPTELTAYLRSTGWREVEYKPEHFSVWLKDIEGDQLEILLPLRRSLGDYVPRMAEAVGTLATVENRSQLEVLWDLQTAGSDVVRVRFRHADASDGSMPLDRGAALVENSREMMLAGACAVVSRRAYFAARKPEDARKFVQNLRLGQSERGSYVLTILSRVNPQLKTAQGTLLEELEPPFERKAVTRLSQALAALRVAAGEAMTTCKADVFHRVVEAGVSANLCSALVNMNGQCSQPKDELRISFTWARSRPAGPESVREVVFPEDHFPVIGEAARLFRMSAPPEETEIRGAVVQLRREEQQGPPTGPVIVMAFVDGKPRRVQIMLDESSHRIAVQAYENGLEITCQGDLVKSGASYVLQNAKGFAILVGE